MQNTLTRLHLNDIISKQRGSMAIVKDRVECDLFDWLEKKGKIPVSVHRRFYESVQLV